MGLNIARIKKPGGLNSILGQAHFMKIVRDCHGEAMKVMSGVFFNLVCYEILGRILVGTELYILAFMFRHRSSGNLRSKGGWLS